MLFNCCCQELQNDLQNIGLQVESTEQDIINKIKENAGQTVNKLWHMCKFFKMDQEEDNNSPQYGARLKAAAKLCDFTIGSGDGKILFKDQMVTDRLVAVLKNKDITKEIIELAAINKTRTSRLILREVEELIQVKEQSREDIIQLEGKSKAGVHKMKNQMTKTYVKDKMSAIWQVTTRPPGTIPRLGPGLLQVRKHRPTEGCVQNQGTKHERRRNHGRPHGSRPQLHRPNQRVCQGSNPTPQAPPRTKHPEQTPSTATPANVHPHGIPGRTSEQNKASQTPCSDTKCQDKRDGLQQGQRRSTQGSIHEDGGND